MGTFIPLIMREMMVYFLVYLVGLCTVDVAVHGANHWRATDYAGIVPRMDYLFRTSATPHLIEFLDHEHRLVSFRERSWLYDSLLFGDIKNRSALKKFPDLLSNAIDYPRNRSGNGITPLSTSSILLAQKDLLVEDFVDMNTLLSSQEKNAVPECTRRTTYSMHLYMHLKGVAAAVVGNLTLNPEQELAHAAWAFFKHDGQEGGKGSAKRATVTVGNDEMGARIARELSRNPEGSWALFNLAAVFWRIRGNTSQAATCLQHAIAMAPHDYRDVGMVQLGNLLYRAELFKDAQILIEAALLTTNEEARRAYGTQYLHGNILSAQGYTVDAYRAYQRAVALQPELSAALQMFRQSTEDMKRRAARARRQYEINLRKVTMVLPPTMTWHDFEYELPEDPCVGVVCGEHAECESIDQKCHCKEGWLAATGTNKCIRDTKCAAAADANARPPVVCGQHEICRAGRCYCKPGFHRRVYKSISGATANASMSGHGGVMGSASIGNSSNDITAVQSTKGPCTADPCARASCIDRATCNPTTGRCECQTPYVQVGAYCMDTACRSVTCSDNAICHLGKCYCAIGFRVAEEDANCTMCVPDPPCTNTKCPDFSACNISDGHCRCLTGYVVDVSKNTCVRPANNSEATLAPASTTLHNTSVLPSTVLLENNHASTCPHDAPDCHAADSRKTLPSRMLAPPTQTMLSSEPTSSTLSMPPVPPKKKRTVHAEGKADDATYTLLLRANLCENHKHVAFDWIKQGYILNPTKCIATEQLDAIEFVDLDEMAQAIIDASLVEFSNVLVQQPYCIDAASTGLPWRMSMMDHLDLFAVTRSFVTNRSATSMYAAWRDVVSVRRVLSTMLNTAVAQGTPHALRARAKYVGLYNVTRDLDALSSIVQPLAGHVLAQTLAQHTTVASPVHSTRHAVQLLAAQWWLGEGNVSAAMDCVRAMLHSSGRASASQMADMVPPLLVAVQIALRIGHTDDLDTLANVAVALSEARQDTDTASGEKRSMMTTMTRILADAIHGRPERAIAQLEPLLQEQERLVEASDRDNMRRDYLAVVAPIRKLSQALECTQLQKILAQTADFAFAPHLAKLEQLLAAKQQYQHTVAALEDKYNNVLAETGDYKHASIELDTARKNLLLISERVMEELRVMRNIEAHLPHHMGDSAPAMHHTDGTAAGDEEDIDSDDAEDDGDDVDAVDDNDGLPPPVPTKPSPPHAPGPTTVAGAAATATPKVPRRPAVGDVDGASIERSVSSLMASVSDLLELDDDDHYGDQDASEGSESDSTARAWLSPTWPSVRNDCAAERMAFTAGDKTVDGLAKTPSLVPDNMDLELNHVFQSREARKEFKALSVPLNVMEEAWGVPRCTWTTRMQERWGQHPPPLKQLSKLKVFQKGGAAALNLTPSNELVPLLTQNFRVVSGIDGTRDPSQSMSLAEAGERIRTSLAKSKAPWSLLHLAAVYWQIRGAAVETLECLKLACQTSAPPKDSSLLVLSDLLFHAGDPVDAVILATKAIRLNVRAANSHYHLANVLATLYETHLGLLQPSTKNDTVRWDRATLLSQAVFFYKTATLLDKQHDGYAVQYRRSRCWEVGFL